MHWSASIAQLVATALMTALRIWIRRRIVVQPAVVEVPDDHILDWLALRIGRSCEGVEDSRFNFWPGHNETLQILSPLPWRIYTDDHNFAYTSGNKAISQIMTAQYAANARRRLGRLTEWTGKATKPSIAVSQSISVVMRILFGNDPNMSPFVWCLKVQVGDEPQSIEFRVENIMGKWKADATKIEAALSLWMFHIWLEETRNGSNLKSNWVRKRTDADWLQQDPELRHQVIRVLGPNTDDFRKDLKWWLGNSIDEIIPQQPLGFSGPIGFVGLESQTEGWGKSPCCSEFAAPLPAVTIDLIGFSDKNLISNGSLKVKSESTLERLLAQHVFAAFMWAIASVGKSTRRIELMLKNQTTVVHHDEFRQDDPETLLSLKFENKVLTGIANDVHRSGLGNLEDVYMCIIPPLICTNQLPSEAIIDFVWLHGRDHGALERWEEVVRMYIKLFQVYKTPGNKEPVLRKATAILIDAFQFVCTTIRSRLQEQRQDGVAKLESLRNCLLQELKPGQQPDLQHGSDSSPKENCLQHILHNLYTLYTMQRRLDRDVWKYLVSDVECAPDDDVHRYFEHPPAFTKIMSINRWDIDSKISAEDINSRDALGWSLLHYAAVRGDEAVIRELLKRGADPKAIDLVEWSPLHYAIETTEQTKLKANIGALLQGGADVRMRGRDGTGPLHCAAKKGHTQATKQLLSAGAYIEIRDNSRKTPLLWAARNGNGDTVQLLLDKGAFIGAQDDFGRTALHLAVTTGVINVLIANQIEIEAKDQYGRTALHLAVDRGDETIVRLLIEQHGANKDAKDNYRRTALHLAALNGDIKMVQLLVEQYGAAKDARDNYQRTVLHVAVHNCHIEMVRQLLDHYGADTEARDNYQRTALHLAARNGDNTMVQLLIEQYGAEKDATDNYGRTALHLATRDRKEATVRLLVRRHGADMEVKDTYGRTALHLAARNSDEAIVRLLVEHYAVDKDVREKDGRTALHWAAQNNDEAIVQLLVEHGANKGAKDNDGRTALQLANERGHEVVVRLLN